MEENKILMVKSLLFDSAKEDTLTIIPKIQDSEVLYVYAYNYNWDEGFEIPQLILDNDKCNLSIALLIFYRADGASYLMNKSVNANLPQWSSFIKKLYNSILDGKYKSQEFKFKVPLSTVQLFKLKKILSVSENIFIKNIEGKNLDIDL